LDEGLTWKGQLKNVVKAYNPKRDRCKQVSEMASHILGDCKPLATLRIKTPGLFYETR